MSTNNSLHLFARDSVKVSKKIGMALLYDQPSAGSERKNTIQDQTCDNVPSGQGVLHASEDDHYGAVV